MAFGELHFGGQVVLRTEVLVSALACLMGKDQMPFQPKVSSEDSR